MSDRSVLNGSDYLMLGFDHELRRLGYAGNSCQIILELGCAICRERLEKRLSELCRLWPIVHARPGGLMLRRWKVRSRPRSPEPVSIRVHQESPGIEHAIVNEPLAMDKGELLRFDLIQCAGGRSKAVFSWAHALMDAPSAEYLLAIIGREDLPFPTDAPRGPKLKPLTFLERIKLAWKTLYRIDNMRAAGPRSLGIRNRAAPRQLAYLVEKFSAEESQRIRENAVRISGVLGAAQFHAAAAMFELHRLHERLGRPSPGYVLPLPVGLRPKGAVHPIFSNQVTMLMTQFLPKDVGTIADAAALIKREMQDAVRSNLLESGRQLSELFRFLPLPLYMAVLKKGLCGEICSVFYGDTAAVNPNLTAFLDAPILDFVHVAAITPSPGIGVIFYYFQKNLRVTVLHLLPILSVQEAGEFAANLRRTLLGG